MFLSAPSTGKTALMEAKAFQCMQIGMNVLFLLPFAFGYNKAKTLLTLKMQQQWKNLKEKHQWQNEFHVFSLKRKESSRRIDFEHFKLLVQSEAFRDAAIFADELEIWKNDDLQALTNMAKMYEQRTIWLAITYFYNEEVTTKKVKSEFERHNFYIPELVNPIRNSKEIVKHSYPSILLKK